MREWAAETLLPVFRQTRRVTGGRQPLFPGYLFSRFPETGISTANSTYGVHQVVRFGTAAAVVDDALIAEIKGRLDQDGVVMEGTSGSACDLEQFQPGDRVRVTAGPFMGLTGIFDRRLGATTRNRILLEQIASGAGSGWSSSRKPVQNVQGCSARLTVDGKDLERIG